jgi:hypothetical protein
MPVNIRLVIARLDAADHKAFEPGLLFVRQP